jgi:hypothetical protein
VVVDLKHQLIHAYVLERKKMTEWYTRMFRILLSVSVFNSMVICRANSQGKQVDHLKFLIDMVLAVFVQHGGGVERKVPG